MDADGKLYGEGHFSAVWLLPVDSLNDRFMLDAQLPEFDLTALNEMIAPMASAELRSGQLTGLNFCMDASSKTGSIYMLLLYEDMKVNIFKIEEGEKKDKRFLNWLANAVVRDHNPNRPDGKPREVFTTIERDPYHSTFNYLWQMLRPALAESVGITKTQQKIAMGISGFIGKIKKLFAKGKEEEFAKKESHPE
ncbi:MAG: hypothetical protein LUG51_13820 [Tannerellaceae bacterium]|nr:hypothetical protein [Tannerellaceae bacterium]